MLFEYNFAQINNIPSREVNNNILDLILTTQPTKVTDIHTCMGFVNSDHLALMFNILHDVSMKINEPRLMYSWSKVNYDE